MKNIFFFSILILLASCSCDDSEITGVDFYLIQSNVIDITNGVTTTTDGSAPVTERNPETVIYDFSLNWDLDRTVYSFENCINSLNNVTSISLICDRDFTQNGNTISAGTSMIENDPEQIGSFLLNNQLAPFSFEPGVHTFTLEITTDDNLKFIESITTDIQI
jgi:hypothetical protein